jgi:dTMP kinase
MPDKRRLLLKIHGKNMLERGKYIVGEGGDGTGKTTQVLLLDNFIRSLGADTLRVFNEETGRMEPVQEPGGTPIANKLRIKIKDKSIDRSPWQNVVWLTDARLSLNEELIQPSLEKGMFVLSARNWYSSVAYQGYGQGIPINEIEDYTKQRVGEVYMNPDFAGILAIEDELARRRRLENRLATNVLLDTFESLPADFQDSMQAGYVEFGEKRGIPIINAGQPKVKVFADLLRHVEPLLEDIVA